MEAIFRRHIGWMRMHFVGVRWKCFGLFWELPQIRSSDGCGTTAIIFPCWRPCPNIHSQRPLCESPSCINIIHAHYNWRTCMLAFCGDVRLHIFFLCACVLPSCFVFFRTISQVSVVLPLWCTALMWCNIMFKGKDAYREVGRKEQMSSGRYR